MVKGPPTPGNHALYLSKIMQSLFFDLSNTPSLESVKISTNATLPKLSDIQPKMSPAILLHISHLSFSIHDLHCNHHSPFLKTFYAVISLCNFIIEFFPLDVFMVTGAYTHRPRHTTWLVFQSHKSPTLSM